MGKIIILLLLIATYSQIHLFNFSQKQVISGRIINSENNKSIPYTNIGIAKKGVGTVSNYDGNYHLNLNDEISENDTVIFSHIGFVSKKIIVKTLLNHSNEIFLAPSIDNLNEVVVKAKASKEKKIGRHSKGLGLSHTNFYSYYEKGVDDRLSKEKGMKLRIKKNCFIKSLNFNITSNDFTSLKFRVNFYKIENGLPSDIIVHKNIIFEIKDNFLGWYKVDLKPYDIYFEKEIENVAVTIQWVESVKKNEKSKYFSISTSASPTEKAYFREKAMDKWTSSGQSFSFYLDTLCN